MRALKLIIRNFCLIWTAFFCVTIITNHHLNNPLFSFKQYLKRWHENSSASATPSNSQDDKLKILFVGLLSEPGNIVRRNVLRRTWIKYARDDYQNSTYDLQFKFFIGKSNDNKTNFKVKEENRLNNDLVIDDYIDTYYNLTTKTFSILKYFMTSTNYSLMLKADDDVYVNIPRIMDMFADIVANNSEAELLTGHGHFSTGPIRNKKSKWYMPEDLYPPNKYPNYLGGAAYLLSRSAIRRILLSCPNVSGNISKFEDIYFTGICAQKAGLTVKKSEFFVNQFGGSLTPCVLHKHCSIHRVPENKLDEMWPALVSLMDNKTHC